MNLHKLKVFLAVAQRLSITDAAGDLHLTQPAVSLQVRALEKEVGLLLLERGGRKLRLTQAGEHALPSWGSQPNRITAIRQSPPHFRNTHNARKYEGAAPVAPERPLRLM